MHTADDRLLLRKKMAVSAAIIVPNSSCYVATWQLMRLLVTPPCRKFKDFIWRDFGISYIAAGALLGSTQDGCGMRVTGTQKGYSSNFYY